ncbi:MAG: nitrogen regulation protein NR(II), partial [Candidatus Zixiibacteriota bacterium]
SLVSLAYTFIIWLGLGDAIDSGSGGGTLQIIFSVQDSVFYAIFLHMLIFYVVAFISGFLAERLSYRDVQLARASVELKQARLETDDILHHLNSGLLSVDSVGAIIYFNRAAERILGYQERDIKGLPCRMVFAQRMPHLADRLMETVSYRMEHPRRELEIVNVDGDTIPIGVSTSVLTDDAGGVRGVIAIFTDLTDAKKLEAKVRSADRLAAIGELSASIAHEIRNPLAAISGSVEVLQKELQLRGESGGLMDLIVKESHRLSRLLTDFLSFARVDSSSFEKVELGHVINDVMRILSHHQSFSSGIELRLETDEPTTYVIGDADLIKQLLLNLAVNSCEAFGERPGLLAFHIISSGDGGVVELVVQDDGPGMTRETMKQIFRPFYSTKKQGSGLGLAIVHRICTAIHADINVDSRSGAGTTFHILFRGYQTRRTLESSDHKARTPATT